MPISCRLRLLLLILSALLSGGVQAATRSATWTYDGLERRFWIEEPDSWDRQTPLPLVIALHPFGSNGESFLQNSGWQQVSNRHGVIVVSPDGSRAGGGGGFSWNSYVFNGTGADDLGFLAALPAEIGRQIPVDQTRVYVTGFSNGAMMASSLACARSSSFAAFAPVAGGWLSAYGGSDAPCRPSAPVAMWLWRGERERQVTGTTDPQPRDVQDELQKQFWVQHNGGGQPTTVTESIEVGGVTRIHTTSRWDAAAPTWFTEVGNASHQYFPGAAERIWTEFFRGRQRDSAPQSPPASSEGLEYGWAVFASGVARGVALGPAGDVWVAGSYSGTLALPGRTLTSRGGSDAFVARFSDQGALLAAASFGDVGADFATDIVVSSTGRVYVTGGFSGSLGSSIPALPTFGGIDSFVIEVAGDAAPIDARSFGGATDDYGNEIDADAVAVAVAVNATSGLTVPGLGSTPQGGGDEGFVVVLDAPLQPRAVLQVGGSGSALVRAVAVSGGVVTFAGECMGELSLFDTRKSCDAATDGYVAQWDRATTRSWVRFAEGAGLQSVRGIGVDARGRVTALGRFEPEAVVDGRIVLSSVGARDLFVWQMDAFGLTERAFAVGSPGLDEGGELVVADTGVFSIAGHFRGEPALKPALPSTGYRGAGDEYVLSFSSDGRLIGLSRGGGTGAETHYAMAETAFGNVSVGTFSGNTRFGSATAESSGLYIAFRTMLPGPMQRSTQVGDGEKGGTPPGPDGCRPTSGVVTLQGCMHPTSPPTPRSPHRRANSPTR